MLEGYAINIAQITAAATTTWFIVWESGSERRIRPRPKFV